MKHNLDPKYVYKEPRIITDEYGTEFSIPPNMIEEFKEVIKRGTAFGTQTSPEMKIFADTLLGRISYTANSSQLHSAADYKPTTAQVLAD